MRSVSIRNAPTTGLVQRGHRMVLMLRIGTWRSTCRGWFSLAASQRRPRALDARRSSPIGQESPRAAVRTLLRPLTPRAPLPSILAQTRSSSRWPAGCEPLRAHRPFGREISVVTPSGTCSVILAAQSVGHDRLHPAARHGVTGLLVRATARNRQSGVRRARCGRQEPPLARTVARGGSLSRGNREPFPHIPARRVSLLIGQR